VLYFAAVHVADQSVEIPNRAAFKASEVCEIAQIPSYVLRSWEKEFPRLGAAARPGGARIYRRADVEQILHIKQLVFAEGLTLAGARRKIEGDAPFDDLPLEPIDTAPPQAELSDLRERVLQAKQELRDLLKLLSPHGAAGDDSAAADRPAPQASGGWPPMTAAPKDDLPLGDESSDATPRPRRKRSSKGTHDESASKVE
jgi:DNA-binding transcriptional MerR regulator